MVHQMQAELAAGSQPLALPNVVSEVTVARYSVGTYLACCDRSDRSFLAALPRDAHLIGFVILSHSLNLHNLPFAQWAPASHWHLASCFIADKSHTTTHLWSIQQRITYPFLLCPLLTIGLLSKVGIVVAVVHLFFCSSLFNTLKNDGRKIRRRRRYHRSTSWRLWLRSTNNSNDNVIIVTAFRYCRIEYRIASAIISTIIVDAAQ